MFDPLSDEFVDNVEPRLTCDVTTFVDAAVADAQVSLDAATAQPLCSEVESAPIETIVPLQTIEHHLIG